MSRILSNRLRKIIDALPLRKGMRVLEIGCGPSAAAREISTRIGDGLILGIDRSAKAIQQAIENSQIEIQSGRLSFRQVAVENFELTDHETPFDLAIAIRVGALDGRHPELEAKSLSRIAKALTKSGKLFIDGGDPICEVQIKGYR